MRALAIIVLVLALTACAPAEVPEEAPSDETPEALPGPDNEETPDTENQTFEETLSQDELEEDLDFSDMEDINQDLENFDW